MSRTKLARCLQYGCIAVLRRDALEPRFLLHRQGPRVRPAGIVIRLSANRGSSDDHPVQHSGFRAIRVTPHADVRIAGGSCEENRHPAYHNATDPAGRLGTADHRARAGQSLSAAAA